MTGELPPLGMAPRFVERLVVGERGVGVGGGGGAGVGGWKAVVVMNRGVRRVKRRGGSRGRGWKRIRRRDDCTLGYLMKTHRVLT